MTGQRHVATDDGAIGAAQPLELAPGTLRIRHVPAMFAMHPCWHPGKTRRHHAFERGKVARMHHCGAPLAEQPIQARIKFDAVAGWLVQRQKFDVSPGDALAKRWRAVGKRHHRMTKALGRHAVDQVDDAVFQPTDVETVNEVHHQRPCIAHEALPTRRSKPASVPDAVAVSFASGRCAGPSSRSSTARCAGQL